MHNLPDFALSHMTTYLSKTTRPLLASALMAPSSSWERSCGSGTIFDITLSLQARVVMACPQNEGERVPKECSSLYEYSEESERDGGYEGWEVLNFMDVEQGVRRRLTDGDLAGILVCIDAVNNLKVLRLPICINMSGEGLVPLNGSIKLEIIDVGLMAADHGGSLADMGENPGLSADCFLQQMIRLSVHSLKRLHVPMAWVENPNSSDESREFAEAMMEILNRPERQHDWRLRREKRVGCLECDRSFSFDFDRMYITVEEGSVLKSCPECDLKYCERCYNIKKRPQCSRCLRIKCENCSENAIAPIDIVGRVLCRDCEYLELNVILSRY